MSKNEKVTENKEQKEQTEQKVMTKYDRKVQKRKEEKEKEKKEERISTTVGIVFLVALVCLVASFPIRTYLATHETYVVINGEKVNKVEFDYVYNTSKNNYITQYGSYLSYFGLDTSKDLSTQMYSDTLTWQDYFEQNAVESLKQNKALMAEAKAAGFTYDTTDEYNTFKETIKTSAAAAGVSDKEYVRSIYGSYATMGRIEGYVKNDMVMNAYYQKLQEDNAPSDDEIQSYYEENKATYDSVDYRLTTIEADLPLVVRSVIPEIGEQGIRLAHLLHQIAMKGLQTLHHTGIVRELGVVAETVDTIVAQELGIVVYIGAGKAIEHFAVVVGNIAIGYTGHTRDAYTVFVGYIEQCGGDASQRSRPVAPMGYIRPHGEHFRIKKAIGQRIVGWIAKRQPGDELLVVLGCKVGAHLGGLVAEAIVGFHT